jgi:pyrroline-5-carboxylate reductase
MDNTTKICFIGGGHIARAIIGGMLNAGFASENIWVTARSSETVEKLKMLGKINISFNNLEAIQNASIIFLAVKPKDIPGVLTQLKSKLEINQIIISLAAGLNIETLSPFLKPKQLIIRVMPNTPSQVKQGIYGLYADANITADINNQISKILEPTGKTVWLDSEAALDSLTAISGCGPAYVFMLIDSLEQAAVKIGLPKDQAKMLAAQTVLGAATLALKSSESAAQLCQNVCSPGGMTEKGVKYLQEKDFTNLIETAVKKTLEHLPK